MAIYNFKCKICERCYNVSMLADTYEDMMLKGGIKCTDCLGILIRRITCTADVQQAEAPKAVSWKAEMEGDS